MKQFAANLVCCAAAMAVTVRRTHRKLNACPPPSAFSVQRSTTLKPLPQGRQRHSLQQNRYDSAWHECRIRYHVDNGILIPVPVPSSHVALDQRWQRWRRTNPSRPIQPCRTTDGFRCSATLTTIATMYPKPE
jgi:hypothetical protein